MRPEEFTLKYVPLISALIAFVLFSGCAERSDPAGPSGIEDAFILLGQFRTPGWAEDIWVHDSLAFIADGEQGVAVYNILNPANPQLVKRMSTSSSAEKIAYSPVTNTILLNEATGQGGLTMYDYDGLTRLSQMFDAGLDEFSYFDVTSDTIIICDVEPRFGFRIFTVIYSHADNEWFNDEIRGIINLSGSPRGLEFDHEYAYIANNQLGMRILQIEYTGFINNITDLGLTDTPGAARDIALTADKQHAVVADYQGGICLVDISDKAHPSVVSSLVPEKADAIIKVKVVDDVAYFIDQYTALYAADVSDPASPRLIGKYLVPQPVGLFVTPDETVYLADEDLGLVILKLR